MKRLDFTSVLSGASADDHVMAIEAGRPIGWQSFRNDIAATSARLGGVKRAALVCASSYNFAVGLLALLGSGATVVLSA